MQQNETLLPLYQCYKKVRAAEIIRILPVPNLGARLTLLIPANNPDDEYAKKTVEVDHSWLARNPGIHEGGYYVEYQEGDGYTSFSPAAPFTGGYSLISEMRAFDPAEGHDISTEDALKIDADFTAWWRRAVASDGFPGEASGVSPEMIARAAYHAALCGGFGLRPKIAAVEDMVKVQCSDGNWNAEPYMHGLANGLIFAVAVFKGEDPQLLKAPEGGYLCHNEPPSMTLEEAPITTEAKEEPAPESAGSEAQPADLAPDANPPLATDGAPATVEGQNAGTPAAPAAESAITEESKA